MRLNKVQNVESVDCFIQWRRELNVPVIELKKQKQRETNKNSTYSDLQCSDEPLAKRAFPLVVSCVNYRDLVW